jgi:hypothetical protein
MTTYLESKLARKRALNITGQLYAGFDSLYHPNVANSYTRINGGPCGRESFLSMELITDSQRVTSKRASRIWGGACTVCVWKTNAVNAHGKHHS